MSLEKPSHLFLSVINEKDAGHSIFVVSFENTSPVPPLIYDRTNHKTNNNLRIYHCCASCEEYFIMFFFGDFQNSLLAKVEIDFKIIQANVSLVFQGQTGLFVLQLPKNSSDTISCGVLF